MKTLDRILFVVSLGLQAFVAVSLLPAICHIGTLAEKMRPGHRSAAMERLDDLALRLDRIEKALGMKVVVLPDPPEEDDPPEVDPPAEK